MPGRTAAQSRVYRAAKTAQGLCQHCSRHAAVGRLLCQEHLDRAKVASQRWYTERGGKYVRAINEQRLLNPYQTVEELISDLRYEDSTEAPRFLRARPSRRLTPCADSVELSRSIQPDGAGVSPEPCAWGAGAVG